MSGIALILAGHGSHISANTAGIVWEAVDRLRSWAVADEITACFWKEPPAFSQVLDTVEADQVVIVPVFTAQGYFTREVIPTEMGLAGPVTVRDGKTVHLTPTIGEHPHLRSIVRTHLQDVIAQYGLSPPDTAAAIIGHGTRRNRHSRDAARHRADEIRSLNWLKEVVAVYLDDEPDIPSVFRSTKAPNIIALPYFLAEGSHVTRDVPRALGVSGNGGPQFVNGRQVFYCEPVGTDASISRLILELARDTGLPFELVEDNAEPWTGFPTTGRRALIQALEAQNTLSFGQLMVSKERVWHRDNASESQALASPAALRRFVREQPFRPLPTSADLPAGWHVELAHPEQAHAVIETVYPGLVADWAAQKCGDFETESLTDIGTRQEGMFKDIHRLPSCVVNDTVESICGNCIRQPSWWHGFQLVKAELPCRSACNLWLSSARKSGEAAA